MDVFRDASRHLRVHAARVIADHAAEDAAIVSRWIGAEGEPFLVSRIS